MEGEGRVPWKCPQLLLSPKVHGSCCEGPESETALAFEGPVCTVTWELTAQALSGGIQWGQWLQWWEARGWRVGFRKKGQDEEHEHAVSKNLVRVWGSLPWLSLEGWENGTALPEILPSDWNKSLLSPQKILFPKPTVKTFHNLVSTYSTSTIPPK